MTEGAQQALRRTMEIYSATTRFALACNNSTKIIEPIQSRCAVLRFTKLSDTEILQRLEQIADAENVPRTEKGLGALVFTAQGDMRQAINNMQSTFYGFGQVDEECVYKVCDAPHPRLVYGILAHCCVGDIDRALVDLRDGLWKKGYSAVDIVVTMFNVCQTLPPTMLSEHKKLEFIREIGFTHMRVLDGADDLLQMSGLLARLCKASCAFASGPMREIPYVGAAQMAAKPRAPVAPAASSATGAPTPSPSAQFLPQEMVGSEMTTMDEP